MPIDLTLTQFGLIVGIISGLIFGLVPLILGFKRQNARYGLIGFVVTLIAGAVLSLLGAIPVSGIFTWLILRKPAESQPVQDETASENPADVPVNDSENSPENQVSGD